MKSERFQLGGADSFRAASPDAAMAGMGPVIVLATR